MSDNKNWNLIGKRSPQLPQMFYPVADSEMTLTKGDIVAARCTMVCTILFSQIFLLLQQKKEQNCFHFLLLI